MVSVIGLGYIGLPTALAIAATGEHHVIGVEINKNVVDSLVRNELTFEEVGLDELFEKAVTNGIKFSSDIEETDTYIIAVSTPYNASTKKVDMKYVVQAFQDVLNVCKDGVVVVIESTVSPGSIDKHIRPLIVQSGKQVKIAHAPERIIPGSIIYELKHNSRVIGADDSETGERLKEIYASFCKGEIVLTDIRTAEMSKVVENTFRDINIAFANELAKICRYDNMDVYEIIRIANKHPRVNILSPGPGVGGHCISVDPWFLVGDYPGLANIILAARKINDSMPTFVLERIHEIMLENNLTDIARVGLYGLTYKENVDDIRQSPTLQLLTCMKKYLAPPLLCYDPYIKTKVVDHQVFLFEEFIECVDLVVIMVGHSEIIENFSRIKNKVVLDTRKCINDRVYYL